MDDPKARAIFAQAWGVAPDTLSHSPGLTVVEMMHTTAESQLQAMYVMGENPMLSDPNADQVGEALSPFDFLALQAIFLTETAELADVVHFFAASALRSAWFRRFSLDRGEPVSSSRMIGSRLPHLRDVVRDSPL